MEFQGLEFLEKIKDFHEANHKWPSKIYVSPENQMKIFKMAWDQGQYISVPKKDGWFAQAYGMDWYLDRDLHDDQYLFFP